MEPLGQGTIRLMAKPKPCRFDYGNPGQPIAGLGDALAAASVAAVKEKLEALLTTGARRSMATEGTTAAEIGESREYTYESKLQDTHDAGVKKMVQADKERGYVTYDDLNTTLPPDQASSEQIEDTMAILSEKGINVIESKETEEEGKGVPEDEAEAVKWYCKAGEQGHVDAIDWLHEAAEQGHADVQHNLASMYASGRGVSQDEAQYKLGCMYQEGEGVPQDAAEAVKWFRKAAEQGNSYAQVSLGFMYDSGQGVQQGDAEAVIWYQKAADQGDLDAQFYLGIMYEKGGGVPQDYSEAYFWLFMAAANGNDMAEDLRDKVAKRLTASKMEAIQQRTHSWEPKPRR